MGKCFWKNGTERLACLKVATDLQFVQNVISAKGNDPKSKRIMSACTATPAVRASSYDFWGGYKHSVHNSVSEVVLQPRLL